MGQPVGHFEVIGKDGEKLQQYYWLGGSPAKH
jgi:hypothetical protein